VICLAGLERDKSAYSSGLCPQFGKGFFKD
jgi:hypothetical protein